MTIRRMDNVGIVGRVELTKFHRPTAAAFMADAQVPWGVDALSGAVSQPAWKKKPSVYIVATEDRMIPPPAQRAMAARAGSTLVEVKGSVASRSRSYRLVSGNGGNQDSRRTIQLS